jgi:hypothetical protein
MAANHSQFILKSSRAWQGRGGTETSVPALPPRMFSIGIGAAIAFLAALGLWLRYEAAEREAISSVETQKR